jgi:hypothetical protein
MVQSIRRSSRELIVQILIKRWPEPIARVLAALGIVTLCSAIFSVVWAADEQEHHFRIEQRNIKIVVNADGTSVTEWTEVTSLLTETGIEWYGEETVTFSTSRQDLEILEAYTEYPDGQRFALQDKAIRLVEADSAGDSTYSDEKSYVLIFPNLMQGAQTHYTWRLREHTPLHAGHYFETFWFPVDLYYGEATIELSHDPAIDLQIEVSDRKPAITVQKLPTGQDGHVRYRFRYTNHDPVGVEEASVSMMDTAPYVRISSLGSMLEEAKLYQAAARDKEKTSPEIRALADEITLGISDPKDQARAIYNWVATQIRYVGIYLGNGGIIPNDADDILRHRYGDCKDHSTLLVALLAAKGIEAESAMINMGSAYTLPKLGDISPINHVITYLPDWDLYVDSTDRHAAFGVLSYDTSDKPTVLAKSERYHRTPKSSSQKNRISSQVDMSISDSGDIYGAATITATGSPSPFIRSYLMGYHGQGKNEMPVTQLAKFDQVGTGDYSFEAMGDLNNPVTFDTSFVIDPVTNFPGPGAIWVPVGLAPGRIENMRWQSPLALQTFPFVCHSYAYEEHYDILFPDSVSISHLPQSVEFSENGYTYQATYHLGKNLVVVTRILEIEMPSDVCQPGDEDAYNKLLGVVQADLRGQILYVPTDDMPESRNRARDPRS